MAKKNDKLIIGPFTSLNTSSSFSNKKLEELILSKDSRYIAGELQRFKVLNQNSFNFLGIQSIIEEHNNAISLRFKTSNYIGAAPIRSIQGLPFKDIVITPRYIKSPDDGQVQEKEDYLQVLDLIETEIQADFLHELPLVTNTVFKPPLFYEALKFIRILEELIKTSWNRFQNKEKVLKEPKGNVNWNRYINQQYKVENRLRFPSRVNILSQDHKEYQEIKYVYNLCKLELLSRRTPLKFRRLAQKSITIIDNKLYELHESTTKSLTIRTSDSSIVKRLKHQANQILLSNHNVGSAWRIDISDVFEKFVQYLFKATAKELGATLQVNTKFHTKGDHYKFPWELAHLEADAVFRKDEFSLFIDAKYKSNLYNKDSTSQDLKENFRADLHQIMAYSSFSNSKNKHGLLCYPSSKFEFNKTLFTDPYSNVINHLYIVGIPFTVQNLSETKDKLKDKLVELLKHNHTS